MIINFFQTLTFAFAPSVEFLVSIGNIWNHCYWFLVVIDDVAMAGLDDNW